MTGWDYTRLRDEEGQIVYCAACSEPLVLNLTDQAIGCWCDGTIVPEGWLVEHEEAELRGGLYGRVN
jgi:hypothetical protein